MNKNIVVLVLMIVVAAFGCSSSDNPGTTSSSNGGSPSGGNNGAAVGSNHCTIKISGDAKSGIGQKTYEVDPAPATGAASGVSAVVSSSGGGAGANNLLISCLAPEMVGNTKQLTVQPS